ncbi:MAG: CBS domain-containing protein [Persicimonas sp.]
MKIIDLCSKDVVTVTEDQSLFKAAWTMRNRHVGDLVVTRAKDGVQIPVGILTDRDFVTSMVAEGEDDFATTTVGDAMTEVVILAREDDEMVEVLNNMRSNGVRRIPVVDRDDDLVGIVTYDDIARSLSDQFAKLSAVVDAEIQREQQERP